VLGFYRYHPLLNAEAPAAKGVTADDALLHRAGKTIIHGAGA
jgi:hypothetical protein